MTDQQNQQHQQQPHHKPWWKRDRVKWFAAAMVAAVVVIFALWWVVFRSYVSTNDSRVATDLIRVAPVGIGGNIEKVAIQEGDYVKAGQVLVEIDHRIAEANYEKAKARYELANSEQRRLKSLYGKNFSSRRDLDNANMNYQIAEAELKLAEVNLQNTYLKSPIDGVVVQKTAEVGNLLEPGQVAVTIADVDHAWVSANIEETRVAQLKIGQPVAISIDEGGTMTGKVLEITAATASQFSLLPAENAAGNFTKVVQKIPIKISIDPNSSKRVLRAGQSVSIRIRVR